MAARPTSDPRTRLALAPSTAVAGWSGVVVTLNVTTHPLLAAAAFAGLAALCLAVGRVRLVVLGLVVGAGMAVAVPGVALVDGSFSLASAPGAWSPPAGAVQWAMAAGSLLRIPAQVVASVLLLQVPAELLLAAVARRSPRAAIVAALAARMQPMLGRDLALVRDELASRGVSVGRREPPGRRVAAVVAVWEAVLAGVIDRAFVTAAALETRGYGAARPTVGPLRDPSLRSAWTRRPAVDRTVVACAGVLALGAVVARAAGALPPPQVQVLGGILDPITPVAIALAALGLLVGLVPAAAARRPATVQLAHGSTGREAAVEHSPRLAAQPAAVALHLRDVCFTRPGSDLPAIEVADLQLAAGELVVVTGTSGSGKSTLLDVVSGVAPRATGGHRTGLVQVASTTRGERVVAVFQDPEAQVLVGTVAEEVAFGLRHAGLPLDEVERRTAAWLRRLGIGHLAGRACRSLSGGELQRVLLAAALALEPAVLVLDEPTSQVDARCERRFWDEVDRARHESGIAVLAVEHRLDHVLARCDRVVLMHDGSIVHDVAAADVGQVVPHLLAHAYDGLVPTPPRLDLAPRLVLELERIAVGAGASAERTLLRALSLSLRPGSIVSLEGANGSGKSTLLRTVRGLHPAAGSVVVDGVVRRSVGSSVRQLAYLSQQAGPLMPGRTAWSAATQASRQLRLDLRHVEALVLGAGLAHRADDHPADLSVGERQRLALLAATAHRPPVWLLDEPTRGMDVHARRWVAHHVLAHAAAGGVVLVATHDSSLAATIATHRLRLDERLGPELVLVRRDGAGTPVGVPT